MKKLREVVEVENEGLVALLGKKIAVFATNYIYAGKLVGVNDKCIQLEDPGIVYETGEWTGKKFKDIQMLPTKFAYVSCGAIESFFETSMIP